MGISNSDDYRETLNGDAKSLTRLGTGYVAGVGYQTKGGGAGIELRYSGDFSNVHHDGYGSGTLYPGSGNRFRNGVIMLQVNLVLRGPPGRWDWGRGGGGYPYPHQENMPAPRARPQPFPQPTPRPRPSEGRPRPASN